MQEIKYPFFKKDRILKIEMLENLRDFPRTVLDIYNDKLSDGIVQGLTPKVDKDIITFSKGIVKYKGNLYLLKEPTCISYEETEVEVIIKLNFYEEVQDNDYRTQYMEIEIDPYKEIETDQLELGRFKLKKGAYLRSEYQDLKDFVTEYNTINVTQVFYSGYGESTINPLILKYFTKEALATRVQNQMDITFCMLCLNNERVERETICHYIAYKLEEEATSLTNAQLHKKLVHILENIKKENGKLKRVKATGQKIIID